MNSYTFLLNFILPDRAADPEQYLDALYEAGCDDAVVGIGQRGMIGLDFTRAAVSAEDALRSAIDNVRAAIPGAPLVQAGPDLVGLTQMAEIFGFSRQNMRKYATGQSGAPEAFPSPVVLGEPSLWHLAEIVAWLKLNTTVQAPDNVLEVSKAAAKLNFEVERKRHRKILHLS
jgi:predicted DNA-binding transcriptional regulator AlpA